MQLSAGFITGFNAYLAGVVSCPYVNALSAEALAWERGWREASYTKAELSKAELVASVEAGYEYKHVMLYSFGVGGVSGLESPLDNLAKKGWRVIATITPSRPEGHWEFLLERLRSSENDDTK